MHASWWCLGASLAIASCSDSNHPSSETTAASSSSAAGSGGAWGWLVVPNDPPPPDCIDACYETLGPALRLELDVASLGLPEPPPGSKPVQIGLFLLTTYHQPTPHWSEAEAAARVTKTVSEADALLAQCGVHVELQAAHVVDVPMRLLDIQGNSEGSWGGHPPAGTENPDLFNYEQNERLTDEATELFSYGHGFLPPNAIAAYTVEHITYYAEQEPTEAEGLSYPPNSYHHVDDYPLRNSVLLVPSYEACGALPGQPSKRTLAHEIGHMLLNSGTHPDDPNNLMSSFGDELTAKQCSTLQNNLDALFGTTEVPDPGPP